MSEVNNTPVLVAKQELIGKLREAGLNCAMANTLPTINAVQQYAQNYNGGEGVVAQTMILITYNAVVYEMYEKGLISEQVVSNMIYANKRAMALTGEKA